MWLIYKHLAGHFTGVFIEPLQPVMCCGPCVFKFCQTNSKVSGEKANTDRQQQRRGPSCFPHFLDLCRKRSSACEPTRPRRYLADSLQGNPEGLDFSTALLLLKQQEKKERKTALKKRPGSSRREKDSSFGARGTVGPIKNTCPADNPSAEPIGAARVASADAAATFTATGLMLRMLKYPVYGLT